MKKFIKFLIIIGAYAAAAFAFFTATSVGKDIWSNITTVGKDIWSNIATKVDTLKTVDNTDDTDNSEEPETNDWGLTKEVSIKNLKHSYETYKEAQTRNNVNWINDAALAYNAIVEDGKETWKDFASLMEAEGLPESLPIIETN